MSNLTQAEIDALMYGDTSPTETDPPSLDGFSSVDAGNGPEAQSYTAVRGADPDSIELLEAELAHLDKSSQYLTPEEKDILGEMGNICMGASATTMYTLLGRRVNITTPQVHVYTSDEVLAVYKTPFVVVTVEYSRGMEGKNLLILRERDSALITELLMGGDGNIDLDSVELDELHLSAMSEIMNQMIGASATSLSNLLGCQVDITPPSAACVGADTDVSGFLDGSRLVIKVSFDMEIEGLLKSKLMQLMPVETGKKLAKALLKGAEPAQSEITPAGSPPPQKSGEMRRETAAAGQAKREEPPAPMQRENVKKEEEVLPVRVKPYTYVSFDEKEKNEAPPGDNPVIDLISDIPLQVAVELGKTKKSINDILNMGIGSVIVLDKMAGELVEVVVNGKHIARGEVVVIDENYGVRITDIDRAL
jgi:flagellar motor switch protein FliN/FliY